METRVLVLNFIDSNGGKSSVSIDNPKLSIAPEEIKPAMMEIIADGVLLGSKMSRLVDAHSAFIVTRQAEDMQINE